MSGRNVVLLLIFLAFLGLVWWLIKSSRRSSQPSVMHSDPIDPAAYRPASVDLSSAGSAPVAGAAGVGMAAGAAPEYQAGAGMPLADPIPAAGAREGDWDDPTVGDEVAAQAAAAESSSGEPAGVAGLMRMPMVPPSSSLTRMANLLTGLTRSLWR